MFFRGGLKVRRTLVIVTGVALVCLAALPSAVFAQSAIAGVVKDTSGAVLPGVTVEATSPVLIEKSRAATTDSAGQYKIVDLRPGAYTVTFSLSGFSMVKRDGFELAANFTQTLNAELRVGALEETITVSGAAPVVGVSMTRPDVGGSTSMQQTYMQIHGLNLLQNTVEVDGINAAQTQLDG